MAVSVNVVRFVAMGHVNHFNVSGLRAYFPRARSMRANRRELSALALRKQHHHARLTSLCMLLLIHNRVGTR